MSHSEDLPEPPQHAAPSRFAAATNTAQQQEAWDQLKQVLGHPQAPGTPTLKEPASGPTEAACTAHVAAAVKAAVKTAVSEHVKNITALEDQLRTARAAPPTAASPAAAEAAEEAAPEVRRLQEKIANLETKLDGDLGKTCSSLVAEGIDKAKVEWEKTVPARIKTKTDPLQKTIEQLNATVERLRPGETGEASLETKLAAVGELMDYLTIAAGIAPDWLSANVSLLDEVDAVKTLKHEFESKKLSLAAICMGFDEAKTSMLYGGAPFQITDFTVAQTMEQIDALKKLDPGFIIPSIVGKNESDKRIAPLKAALKAAKEAAKTIKTADTQAALRESLADYISAYKQAPLTPLLVSRVELLMRLMAARKEENRDVTELQTIATKKIKEMRNTLEETRENNETNKILAEQTVEDPGTEPDPEKESWLALNSTYTDIKVWKNPMTKKARLKLPTGKYYEQDGAYQVEDADGNTSTANEADLVEAGFLPWTLMLSRDSKKYFEVSKKVGGKDIELKFGTDEHHQGSLDDADELSMFGYEEYKDGRQSEVKALKQTILTWLSNNKPYLMGGGKAGEGMIEAMTDVLQLVAKGAMYDELEDRGLIVDENYVGGFFEKGTENAADEIVRVNDAFKLLHVVMKCTVGMVTSKRGNVDEELDKVEAEVTKRVIDALTLIEEDDLADGLIEEVKTKITAIKDLSKRDNNLSETGSDTVLLNTDGLLKKASAIVLFKVSSGITSFLFTATGDKNEGGTPFASIADIAFQFLKARDFVKSVIAKTMTGDMTDTDVNTDTLYFGAGDANQIIARMLMAYS